MSPQTVKKAWSWPARLLLGGILVGVGFAGQQVVGSIQTAFDYDSSGNVIEREFITNGEFNVFVSGSGGNANYYAAAIGNPVTAFRQSDGSGAILELYLECGPHPKNTGTFDVVLAASPTSASGHTVLIDDACSGTGTWARMSTPTGWGSGEYIVVKSLTDPTTGFQGRLRGRYKDIYGE